MTIFLTLKMVILWYNMSVCFLLKQTKEEKMTKEQEGKPNNANTCHTSACIIAADILLVKARYTP